MRIYAKGIDLHDLESLLDLEDVVQQRLGAAPDRAVIRKYSQILTAEVRHPPGEKHETRESAGNGGNRTLSEET